MHPSVEILLPAKYHYTDESVYDLSEIARQVAAASINVYSNGLYAVNKFPYEIRTNLNFDFPYATHDNALVGHILNIILNKYGHLIDKINYGMTEAEFSRPYNHRNLMSLGFSIRKFVNLIYFDDMRGCSDYISTLEGFGLTDFVIYDSMEYLSTDNLITHYNTIRENISGKVSFLVKAKSKQELESITGAGISNIILPIGNLLKILEL